MCWGGFCRAPLVTGMRVESSQLPSRPLWQASARCWRHCHRNMRLRCSVMPTMNWCGRTCSRAFRGHTRSLTRRPGAPAGGARVALSGACRSTARWWDASACARTQAGSGATPKSATGSAGRTEGAGSPPTPFALRRTGPSRRSPSSPASTRPSSTRTSPPRRSPGRPAMYLRDICPSARSRQAR